jgi:hypothetical protein
MYHILQQSRVLFESEMQPRICVEPTNGINHYTHTAIPAEDRFNSMSIAVLYWKAVACFRQLLSSLDEADDNTGTLADDFGRLKVWAENVAAHRHGTISLDHRLREASTMKKLVEEMLNDLRNALEEGELTFVTDHEPFVITFNRQ